MNTYVKIIATIALCGLYMSAMAADRFIVKYKLDESQEAFLSSYSGDDVEEAYEQIREELMEKLSQKQLDALSKVAGVQVKYLRSLAIGAHVITLSENLNEEQTKEFIRKVEQYEDIDFIEEDEYIQPLSLSINPNSQWDMMGHGEFLPEPAWNGDNFVKAWEILDSHRYEPGENVVIAVLDTGYTPHPNFINNLEELNGVYGYDFISDCRRSGKCPACTAEAIAINEPHSRYEPDGLDLGNHIANHELGCPLFLGNNLGVRDSSWHGSHVIGTIVANGYSINNQDHITGGAYGAKVVPVRVTGKGGGIRSDVADAIMWAAGFDVHNTDGTLIPGNPNSAHIINMSFGRLGACPRAYQDAIDRVVRRGVIVVVSAGNDQKDANNHYLSNCRDVISVAARGPTGELAHYSNFGDTTITASGGDSAVLDPLSKIRSTVWSSPNRYQDPLNGGNGAWTEMQGTSMATPHVSAAIAILIGIFKAQNKEYTKDELINILQNSAMNYNNCNNNGCTTNNHALDVGEAVDRVLKSYWPSWASTSIAIVVAITTCGSFVTIYMFYRNRHRRAMPSPYEA